MPDSVNSRKIVITARTLADLRRQVAGLRVPGKTKAAKVGFVPTMGALHDGHLQLVKHAKSLCDKVVVSIFVNPLQFAPTEDLDRYPRQEGKDVAMLQDVGCDLVYLPAPDVLYPEGFVSRIEMDGPAKGLESDFRPQFFSGVATVVSKLFNQVRPDIAVFGEKDYQQLAVIRAMVRDFDMDIDVVGYPTVREADGLALSSRNAYLNAAERAIAPKLFEALQRVRDAARTNEDIGKAIEQAKRDLVDSGFDRIDYLAVRDADTLGDLTADSRIGRILVAAWLGKTRLIDNISA